MKHKIIRCAQIVLYLSLAHSYAQQTPYTITFFIRPMPISPTEEQKTAIDKQKTIVEKIPTGKFKTLIKKEFNPELSHSGLYASYAGMSAHSNAQGQITFERSTPETKLRVLVTEDIKSVPINPDSPKTIYGFVINPKAQAAQYEFERMQDPETELYSWHVRSSPVAKSGRIPFDTIIIFAHPKELVVPLGKFPSIPGENLFLPDMSVTPEYHSVDNVFRFLKIRQFFAPIKFDNQFFPELYQQKVSP